MIGSQVLSVCVPVYRRSQYIRSLIDSIPSSLQVFVSDNGGLVEAQIMPVGDNVIFTTPSGAEVVGPFENWNASLISAKSDWVLMPGDDDEYFPGVFDEIIFPALEGASDAAMIVFGHEEMDEWGVGGRTWCPSVTTVEEPDQAFDKFKYGVDARMPSIAFRRSVLLLLGGFDESFTVTAGDSELIQRVAMNYKVMFVSEIVSRYRVWGGNDTSSYIKSHAWHIEIKHWVMKLKYNISRSKIRKNIVQIRHIQHEIILRNYISSLVGCRIWGGVKFLILAGYPFLARPGTQLACALMLIKGLGRKA